MSITPACNVHCGISEPREGHCDCELCHDGTAPVIITRSDLLAVVPKAPMCAAWYKRAGDYRPWQDTACPALCGVSPHAPAEQHEKHCPVRDQHDRELLGQLTGAGNREG